MSKERFEEKFLRLRQVLEVVPVSKSTWWAWVASGKAPKPVKLGPATTAWRLSEVQAWAQKACS